jgi:adenine-specific DNA glycosylase
LAQGCVAHATSRSDVLPVVPKKRPPRDVALVGLVARGEDGRVWLTRSQGSLFGGLWGVPLAEVEARGSAREQNQNRADRHAAAALAEALGLRGELARRPTAQVEHVLTHRRMLVEVFELGAAEGEERADLKPVALARLSELGVAKLTRKILAAGG